jgi:hypothetical protein
MNADARADREVIRQAAAAVRRTTTDDQHRGGHRPAAAFSLCLLLDELALHAGNLPDDLRRAVTAACREILHHRSAK